MVEPGLGDRAEELEGLGIRQRLPGWGREGSAGGALGRIFSCIWRPT